MEMRSKMKEVACFPHLVCLWLWVDENTIGIITDTAVFHWSMEGDSAPVEVFKRHPSLATSQILNYKRSPDTKWLVLNGIAQEAGQIVGKMQLYSVEKKLSQPIPGFAADFAE